MGCTEITAKKIVTETKEGRRDGGERRKKYGEDGSGRLEEKLAGMDGKKRDMGVMREAKRDKVREAKGWV